MDDAASHVLQFPTNETSRLHAAQMESDRSDSISHAASGSIHPDLASDLTKVTILKHPDGLVEVTGQKQLAEDEIIMVHRIATRRSIGRRIASRLHGDKSRYQVTDIAT